VWAERGVTRREAEVLAAVGERLTNAEIAARLYVSERTVESHVSSLLRKLQAADRHELAQMVESKTGPGPGPHLPRATYLRSFVLTDIVGSVSLWERDSEQMAAAVARHDAIISREVTAAGGTFVQSKGEGDSTFSVFTDATEAVAAAVAIQGAIGTEEWSSATPLRIRVGVHTGDAEPREGNWYGPAVNRAARLRALADGGQTLLSGVTAGLVADRMPEGVRVLYRGRRVLRGIERPEEVWELVGVDDPRLATPTSTGVGGLRFARTKFVGRALECGLLDELLDEAWAGEPVTVLISGEAGAGKSRLVSEVAAVVRDRGTRSLVGNCTVVGRTSFAFAPFVAALRAIVQELPISEGDDSSHVAPRLARLVTGLAGSTTSRDPADPDPLGGHAQLGLFEEVLGALEQAAVPDGLLLVIEDLHWADPSSRGLFEFLSRNLHGTPVALVGTVRTDEPVDPGFLAWLAEVQRAPRARLIDLEPFGRDELTDLLAGLLGERPSRELASQVYERSGGNAFLAEELIAVGERGVLVPATVQNLVVARMAGLTAPARDVLGLAAVAGIRVDHRLLAVASDLNDGELLAAERELAENYLLVAHRSGQGYAFRHALTREAVYDHLLPGERQQLHRVVAQALTDDLTLGDSVGWAVAEAVAEHWFAAGELAPALAMSVTAGNAAREVLAVAEAGGHYERALDLWNRVADPETVAGIERTVLLELAAEVASSAGEHDRAIHHVDVATDELQRSGADPTRMGLLYHSRSRYLGRAGRLADSLEWSARASAVVPSDPPSRARARVLAGYAYRLTNAARYENASSVATAALDAARGVSARKDEALAHNALGICLGNTSTDAEAGIHELEQALAIGREIGDTESMVDAYCNLAYALIRLGRFDEAAATGVQATALVQSGALRSDVGMSLLNVAEARFLAGRWNDCEEALERLRDQRAGGEVELWRLALTALLHASRGQDAAAATLVAEADSMGIDEPQAAGVLRAAQAQVALNQAELDAAYLTMLDGLDALASSDSEAVVVSAFALAGVGLQIAADRAVVERTGRETTKTRRAVDSVRTVAARTLALQARATAPAHRPNVERAHVALYEAEVARAEGRSDPDTWQRAAAAAYALGYTYRTAYARFREAEAILATRRAHTGATEALTAAHATARELGAEPLRREIEALVRRAGFELTDEPATSQPKQSHGLPPAD
jgi:class 3 adenylate cyclase/tetratricopeptide (TPR) repeat protein